MTIPIEPMAVRLGDKLNAMENAGEDIPSSEPSNLVFQYSMAISLKRIADSLDRLAGKVPVAERENKSKPLSDQALTNMFGEQL